MQPRCPHTHGTVSPGIGTWPISPATPVAPRTITPSTIEPTANPVPIDTYVRLLPSSSAARVASAAALTSFSTTTGTPSAAPSRSPNGTGVVIPTLSARATEPSPTTWPGIPTPTWRTGPAPSATRATPATIAAITASAPCGVGDTDSP